MLWLLSVTTLPMGKLPPLGTFPSLVLEWTSPLYFSMASLVSLSPLSRSPALIRNRRPGRSNTDARACFYLSTYLPSVRLTASRVTRWRRLPPLRNPSPLRLLKRPLEIMRFDGVISWLLRKLCFSDVIYRVLCRHPVMMTCHSSLFCALYLYMIRLLFHCISLDLSPIFCAIPATNEKIKKRNILCAVSNTFSIVEYDTRT